MKIFRSSNWDPYWNLAVEDHLLDHLESYGRVLFLWQAEHTVVVGKNQNPWRECRLDSLRNDRGLLARRVSGGGAVYHDRGNLNFSLLLPREEYKEEEVYELVSTALASAGVSVNRVGNSLFVDDKKVSGSAFCFRGNSALHHGTVLVSTRLDRLEKYLKRGDLPVETKAVASIPAPVTNLAETAPDLTIDGVANALIETFAARYEAIPMAEDARLLDGGELRALHRKYVQWDWCFGATPDFKTTLETSFPWGRVKMDLTVENGHIAAIELDSEGLDGADVGHVEGELIECAFKEGAMARHIRGAIGRDGNALLEDIADWLGKLPLS